MAAESRGSDDANRVQFDYSSSVLSSHCAAARFGFFSSEEILNISVEEINTPICYSAGSTLTKEAFPNSVHARALGTFGTKEDRGNICPSCGLKEDCPGHYGHIKLQSCVYNPFLITSLYKLCRLVCFDCYRLRISKERTESCLQQLAQMQNAAVSGGSFASALRKPIDWNCEGKKRTWEHECESDEEYNLVWEEASYNGQYRIVPVKKRSRKKNMEVAERLCQELQEADEKLEKERPRKPKGEGWDAKVLEGVRMVLQEYMASAKQKCENCGKKAAQFKKDGYVKIAMKPGDGTEFATCIPFVLRDNLKKVFDHEEHIWGQMLRWLYPGSEKARQNLFFMEYVLVSPNRFRPPPKSDRGDQVQMHERTKGLVEVIKANDRVKEVLGQQGKDQRTLEQEMRQALAELQHAVNIFMDSSKGGNANDKLRGARQVLEKKEGLFRMKMMGKRVNFAGRSVISPDPNLETHEIGIPEFMARNLSYPETVTLRNVERLRKLVCNGPTYPGAREIHETKPDGSKRAWTLKGRSKHERESHAKALLSDMKTGGPPKVVMRHLQDGDPLLVNRQPTLHKPGIMCHWAKVLGNKEQTVRMHYANCNTYNADFDGDEINLHAPQDSISRSEALSIMAANLQFLVPTSGKPLRGLIQDHVIAGVMLTKRDAFFTHDEVCLLLYTGLQGTMEGGKKSKENIKKATQNAPHITKKSLPPEGSNTPGPWKLDPPCIFKPRRLWSGKQVLSMLVKRILAVDEKTRHSKLIHSSKSKTPGNIWGGKLDKNKEEEMIVMIETEILQGVFDKNQFGATSNGMTHRLFEFFGAKPAGMFLSTVARLYTLLLQMRGFTCAYADFLLNDSTEELRGAAIQNASELGCEAVESWVKKHSPSLKNSSSKKRLNNKQLADAAQEVLLEDWIKIEELDGVTQDKMQKHWGNTIDKCIPAGQKIPFPKNNFASMVQTGAKGSKVNHSQIACLLGQQALEGRRVPLMPTRRTLPCFAPYDLAARAGGYITDRFLTGIRPQEFFFHCMAGREGLIDTAVKTSRSGYLQRCLIKHLESLRISYDLTVRDTDGSVVQFLYGEDGVDVLRSSHLYSFDVLYDNFDNISKIAEEKIKKLKAAGRGDTGPAEAYIAAKEIAQSSSELTKDAKATLKDNLKELKRHPDIDEFAQQHITAIRKGLLHGPADPVQTILGPLKFFGSTSEKHRTQLDAFLARKNLSEENHKRFKSAMQFKYLQSLAQPGEAVGVIAAQSMGEPSTQMTLNTFHLAGHGGANVTLGIPRLREIVQTASRKILTPLMKLKVLSDEHGNTDLEERLIFAQKISMQCQKVTVGDMMKKLNVTEQARLRPTGALRRTYVIQFEFQALTDLCRRVPALTVEKLEAFIEGPFKMKLKRELMKFMLVARNEAKPEAKQSKATKASGDDGGEAENDVEAGEAAIDAAEPGEDVANEEADEPPKKKSRKDARNKEDGGDKEANEQDGSDESSDEESGMYTEDEREKNKKAKDEASDAEAEDAGVTDAKATEAKAENDEAEDSKADDLKVKSLSKKRKSVKDEDNDVEDTKTKKGTKKLDDLIEVGRFEGNMLSIVITVSDSECPQKLLVADITRDLCNSSSFQVDDWKGIQRAHVREEDNGEVWLDIEGINLAGVLQLPRGTVDVDHIYTNDIGAILDRYGVEAAREAIVREVKNVFGHYGIDVNHRHLSLIADYMTHAGGFRAFNRAGFEHNTSPLLQMSFETTMQFMTAASSTHNIPDTMKSPASELVVGKVPSVGTGGFSLMADLTARPEKSQTNKKRFSF